MYHIWYMTIRPEVEKETYDEIMAIAKKNSIIKVSDFESALIILLSIFRKKQKEKSVFHE